MCPAVVTVIGIGLVPVGLAWLTAVGARRRGQRRTGAAVAGFCFPVTWLLWYLRDERPFTRSAWSDHVTDDACAAAAGTGDAKSEE